MAWQSSNRRSELPPDWPRRRARILRRDRRRCRWPLTFGGECGAEANEVDHRRDPHDHSPANLWALCTWHHQRKTLTESSAARRETPTRTRRRVAEPHPGMEVPR